ncbi:hypothetical protein [aff. Roholtiella sp. LEGE 12411]|uniref:hypothetical protein n=1 Tax=aff. Roholtiella sp. LEGE 12411 TaxID=1828822 RepID=UPI001881723E|nr:hypothetical protein [aff. Roholtiella sp. LEGE 12411]MBE9038671.1 hypothetical protein [aff. Roholtiella sp. LEGE 12411]
MLQLLCIAHTSLREAAPTAYLGFALPYGRLRQRLRSGQVPCLYESVHESNRITLIPRGIPSFSISCPNRGL